MINGELIVDNFAGGGGASTGMEMATGYSVDIAINHDPEAIRMHKANHPNTKHYCEDVWQVDPVKACNGHPVGLAWFSPDCKHFSKAKGGKPKDKFIRGLAYSSAEHAQIVEGLIKFCESLGCNVFTRDLSTITGRGYYESSSNQIVLNSLLEDTQRLSTLSHEIGHMLEQHGKREISSAQKEFEADCISVLIQSHYGIELTDSRKGHLAEHYKLFEREMDGSDTPLSQEDKIKHVEDVLDASMKVFRQYADQMDEYVKNAIENRPIAVDFDNKPILSFSFEVNECAEFPSMGNTYSNIMSAQEALKIFENIPDYKKNFVGGINLVGKTASGEQLETIPIVNGRSIDLDMLHYYPVVKENLQAEKMVKELVDEARKENYSTYGKYDFSNSASENILAGNRRRRAI